MAKIKLRRDTAANWTTANPVLALGEPGYDTTNNQLKMGTGTNTWTQLSYLIAGADTALGDLRFTGSLMHPVGSTAAGVELSSAASKMFVNSNKSWSFSSASDFDIDGLYQVGVVTLNLVSRQLLDVVVDLYRYPTRSVSINGGAPQPILNFAADSVLGGTITLGVAAIPDMEPVDVTSITIAAVFENRIQLNEDSNNYGIYLDDNFKIDSQRDINLVAADDLRLTGADHVALRNTSHNDPIRIVTDYDRYGMEWRFDTAGTLNTPESLPRTFTARLDSVHQNGVGLPVYTADAWQLTVTFQIDAGTGGVETIISPTPFVQATNPGYESGATYSFTSVDHGIPDYVFTVVLQNVAGTEGNYTADLAVSQPPQPSATISAPIELRLRAGSADFVFNSNGELKLPDAVSASAVVMPYGTIGSDVSDGITMTTNRGTVLFGNSPEVGLQQHFHIMKAEMLGNFDLFFGDDNNYMKLPATQLGVEIGTASATNIWSFGADGSLTFPGGMQIQSSYGGGARLVIDGVTEYVDIRSPDGILIGVNSTGPVTIGSFAAATDIVSTKVRFINQTVPITSTGAAGDQPGQVAFDSAYMYYCTAAYDQQGHQVAVATTYSGETLRNSNQFQLTRTADTLQIAVGDVISDSDGGATSIVADVFADDNFVWVGTGSAAYAAVFPLTFTSPGYVIGGNIWKRVAWSGDTW